LTGSPYQSLQNAKFTINRLKENVRFPPSFHVLGLQKPNQMPKTLNLDLPLQKFLSKGKKILIAPIT
jgi:hypothetical protein